MKVCHWTLGNGSGLNKVAQELSDAERSMVTDSFTVTTSGENSGKDWEKGVDADIHVIHSHIPDSIRKRTKGKLVFIPHGTPEHCFHGAIEQFSYHGYCAGNSFMLSNFWLKTADVTVTFWARHRDLWQKMTHPKNRVRCIPMGIDKSIWKPTESRGKLAGNPSLLSIENCHYFKSPIDLLFVWPDIVKEIEDARLHIHYLPIDQHRFWYPLMSSLGVDYTSFTSSNYYQTNDLINAFVSTDYYMSMVRYGDHNRVCLEAKACGAKLISYVGNIHADYWVTEGDHRIMAKQLHGILSGKIEPRQAVDVYSSIAMAKEMVKIYEEIL